MCISYRIYYSSAQAYYVPISTNNNLKKSGHGIEAQSSDFVLFSLCRG
jgi:hypothetical protein